MFASTRSRLRFVVALATAFSLVLLIWIPICLTPKSTNYPINRSGLQPMAAQETAPEATRIGTCAIDGSTEWSEEIKSALRLLQVKSPEAYSLIQTHVGIIHEGPDEFGPYCKIKKDHWPFPVVIMSRSYTRNTNWCAPALAHEAYHAYLHDWRFEAPKTDFPITEHDSQAEEKACANYQVRVSEEIGAPAGQIEYLKSSDGSHYVNIQKRWREMRKAMVLLASAQY